MIKFLRDISVIKLSVVVLALSSAITMAPKAHALIEVPTLRFGLGIMPLTFTAGTKAPSAIGLGNALTINPMFLWDVATLRARIGLHFLTDIGSKYGFISTSGIGFSYIYYPMGLSSVREVKGDDSSIIKTRISPYMQASVTQTKFSISLGPLPDDYFSASILELSLGGGVDYPFDENLVGFAGVHYRFASISSEENSSGKLNYKGLGLLVGVMTHFF